MFGTEAVRKGWRIRPHKVRIRIGRPLTFPKVENPSPQLAAAVTDRVWPNVMLQWEWLGGLPPLRRAAVIGAGSWGTSVAVMLARAGLEVDLGTRTQEQALELAEARANERYLPGVPLPKAVTPVRAADLELSRHDLVCFAVPAAALPATVAAHAGGIAPRTGVLVMSKGLVPPLGTLPSAFVSERVQSWAVGALGGPAHAKAALDAGASLVLATHEEAFSRQVGDALAAAGFDVVSTTDLIGVELAGCAKNAAALAAAAAGGAGPNAAGAAAGKVFAEIDAYARRSGSQPETFAGLAGTGDLVATMLSSGSRNRRAGELLAQGMAGDEIMRRARADGRGGRLRPAARRPRARCRGRRSGARLAGRADRGAGGAGAVHLVAHGAQEEEGQGGPRRLGIVSVRDGARNRQGSPRRGLHGAVPSPSAGRLLVLVLPGGQPPRRRGPHRADVPAGVPALRARAARVAGPSAAAVADPHRAQPGRQLLPRPVAPSADDDRRRGSAARAAHDRGPGGGSRGPQSNPRMRATAARTIAARR